MEFRLLGAVEASSDGRPVGLGGVKPRTLLATLLVDHGRVVPTSRLLDTIWGVRPPEKARAVVQTYVSTLRHSLSPGGGPGTIVTRPPGYLISIAPGTLDRDIFEQLLRQGRTAVGAGRHREAAGLFRRALAQWCGPALGGVDSELLAGEAARLNEMRLAATEEWIGAELALGRASEVTAELTDLVRRHPFRERMRGQLMIALCRTGRQSEALACYRKGRARLVEELGIEPGPELRAVHAAILRDDLSAVPAVPLRDPSGQPPARRAGPGTPRAVPAQLPPVPPDFTARTDEIHGLVAAISPALGAGIVPVQVIVGRGGVGKSALAARVAHQVAAGYPDGQLYADLRGLDDAPPEPREILGRFLRALGVRSTALPASTEERRERYRTLLADRRLLILLDDAGDERQVRPLLPGSPTCSVLITARRRLAGLAGAHLTELDVLETSEAETFFEGIVGGHRTAAEPEAARQIVGACGGLPLAIRIAGARLASRRRWPLRLLADRLAGEHQRLDELIVGDQDVRACIELSYRRLDQQAQAALRLCGLLKLADFTPGILATASGLSECEGEQVIERLMDAHLIDQVRIDHLGLVRYGLHDLVRLYGRERALAEEAATRGSAASWRALGNQVRQGALAFGIETASPGTGIGPPVVTA